MTNKVDAKREAKDWLLHYKDGCIGSLDRNQSLRLVGALLKAGATSIKLTQPLPDTLWITVSPDKAARVMIRLANYHADETELLSSPHDGYHLIRAWWD